MDFMAGSFWQFYPEIRMVNSSGGGSASGEKLSIASNVGSEFATGASS